MNKTILLVEDDHILAEMYKNKFEKAGFKIVVAFDSEEGISFLKKEIPDLIVLDILLPRQNGIFLLKWMKKESKLPAIPVIVFSNYDDSQTKKEADKLGVREYLIKANYTPKEILDKIESYLK